MQGLQVGLANRGEWDNLLGTWWRRGIHLLGLSKWQYLQNKSQRQHWLQTGRRRNHWDTDARTIETLQECRFQRSHERSHARAALLRTKATDLRRQRWTNYLLGFRRIRCQNNEHIQQAHREHVHLQATSRIRLEIGAGCRQASCPIQAIPQVRRNRSGPSKFHQRT